MLHYFQTLLSVQSMTAGAKYITQNKSAQFYLCTSPLYSAAGLKRVRFIKIKIQMDT